MDERIRCEDDKYLAQSPGYAPDGGDDGRPKPQPRRLFICQNILTRAERQ